MDHYKREDKVKKLKKGGSRVRVLTDSVLHSLELLITSNSELMLNELKNALEAEYPGLETSIPSISRSLEKLMITLKRPHREISRANEQEYINRRKEYSLWFNEKFGGSYDNVIFVDESPFNLHLKRQQARSRVGTRAIIRVPLIRGRNISLIASVSVNGIMHSKVIENTTVNASIFSTYLRELCTFLKDEKGFTNACIILDNARIHRRQDVLEITEEFNSEFKFLSPYSYMLNPIETSFSKIKNKVKSFLRSGGDGNLSNYISMAVNTVTSEDCAGYF